MIESKRVLASGGGGTGQDTGKRHEKTFWSKEMYHYLDQDVSYMAPCICHNGLNSTLNICAFHCPQITPRF